MILLLLEILGGKGGGELERFACETLVASGEDALMVLGEQRCRRLLVVAESGLLQEGQIRRILQAAGGPELEILENADTVPTMKQAVEGSRRIKQWGPDLVAAVGDCGVLDCAKAMVCFSGKSCLLAAIPTAFGSGSEVTDRVLLAHNSRIHLLQNPAMRPDIAILKGAMTEGRSKEEIGTGGFALLASAMEAYTTMGGMLKDIHAREAFSAAWAALPAAAAGNRAARERMQTASVLAGLALKQTGLGLCSAMCSSLGTVFGLSRGKAAAILLPAVIGCNAHASGRRYAELSWATGLGGSREEIGTRNLRAGLIRLRRELGLPGTLVQAGVDIRSVWNNGRRVVELTLEDPDCRNNPVVVDDFMVRRIMEEITGRI